VCSVERRVHKAWYFLFDIIPFQINSPVIERGPMAADGVEYSTLRTIARRLDTKVLIVTQWATKVKTVMVFNLKETVGYIQFTRTVPCRVRQKSGAARCKPRQRQDVIWNDPSEAMTGIETGEVGIRRRAPLETTTSAAIESSIRPESARKDHQSAERLKTRGRN
jgi:hypothetical protein